MELSYGKIRENTIYTKNSFAFLPVFTEGKILWLTNVRKEVELIDNKIIVRKTKGYDGAIYFTKKEIVWLHAFNFLLFNRFHLRLS